METKNKAKLCLVVFGVILIMNLVNIFVCKMPLFVVLAGIVICIGGSIWLARGLK